DAYRSVLTLAVPILERYGFPATVFVPTKWIGMRNRWDPPSELPLDIMTAEELLELRDRGFELAFLLDRGDEQTSRLALPRTPIYPHDARWLYGLKTSGRYRAIRYSPPV